MDGAPPLGLQPRYIHDRDRVLEILEAVRRYVLAGKKVPTEWIHELQELSCG